MHGQLGDHNIQIHVTYGFTTRVILVDFCKNSTWLHCYTCFFHYFGMFDPPQQHHLQKIHTSTLLDD
jgi:hypothetical protein